MTTVMKFYWAWFAFWVVFTAAVKVDLSLDHYRQPAPREATGFVTCSIHNVGGLLDCQRHNVATKE